MNFQQSHKKRQNKMIFYNINKNFPEIAKKADQNTS